MNYALTLVERIGEYLKQKSQRKNMYEFWNYYTLIPDMKENIMASLIGINRHKKGNNKL